MVRRLSLYIVAGHRSIDDGCPSFLFYLILSFAKKVPFVQDQRGQQRLLRGPAEAVAAPPVWEEPDRRLAQPRPQVRFVVVLISDIRRSVIVFVTGS